MKKFLLPTILLVCMSATGIAQIAVQSFRALPHDMDARTNYRKTDQNGDVCALIKVVTTQTGFEFDGGQLGIVAVQQKTAEIWVYVPHSSKLLTIKHPQLGVLRNHAYGMPIEAGAVYEMVLVSGTVETVVKPATVETQWLVITPDPADAMVYINDQYVKQGEYQDKYKPGTYTYRVEAPMYRSEAGKVEITNSRRTLAVKLKPAYGFISINSEPERGAQVVIDGVKQLQTTPFVTDRLSSGDHIVQVVKEMYQPSAHKVTVTDGQTVTLVANLQPNFGTLTISAPQQAQLLVNGQPKGTAAWTGRLPAGNYSLEAQMDKHRPDRKELVLAVGDAKNIFLQPTPIVGLLDVMTSPSDATITIDGIQYRETSPTTIKNLLVGSYTVALSKQGYSTVTRTITIAEGQTATLSEALQSGQGMSIASKPSTPTTSSKSSTPTTSSKSSTPTTSSKSSTPTTSSKSSTPTTPSKSSGMPVEPATSASAVLNPASTSYTETVNGVSIDMVAIKGGTFTMGSPNGESKRERDENQHPVTVSDFYMGRYEVTQAQWVAVMGNNPSYFKKNPNLPVEQVNWNDVQEFIRKLNKLTGRRYRLPTEAEWEYACRAGSNTAYSFGDNARNLSDYAWYDDNSRNKTNPVGTKSPNSLGLYDMLGNVWEWCSDWYGEYPTSAQTNPQGVSSGSSYVLRGSSWDDCGWHCRSANRYDRAPDFSSKTVGFRLVFSK